MGNGSPSVVATAQRSGDFGQFVLSVLHVRRGTNTVLCRGIRGDCKAISPRKRHAGDKSNINTKTLSQRWSSQALRDREGIVPEHSKEFAQHLRLFGVGGHPVHFGLKVAGGDWKSPLICDQLRFTKVIFDFIFQLRL
jgi:hypothetical protein